MLWFLVVVVVASSLYTELCMWWNRDTHTWTTAASHVKHTYHWWRSCPIQSEVLYRPLQAGPPPSACCLCAAARPPLQRSVTVLQTLLRSSTPRPFSFLLHEDKFEQLRTHLDNSPLIIQICRHLVTCLHYIFVFDFHLLPRPLVAAVRHTGRWWSRTCVSGEQLSCATILFKFLYIFIFIHWVCLFLNTVFKHYLSMHPSSKRQNSDTLFKCI